MSVEFVIPIDPLPEVSFIPTFSYEYTINGKLSLSNEMDGETFYLYNIDGTDQKYQYRQLGIN